MKLQHIMAAIWLHSDDAELAAHPHYGMQATARAVAKRAAGRSPVLSAAAEQQAGDVLPIRFDINLNVTIGKDPFTSSRLVTFAPAYVVANAAEVPFEVTHMRSDIIITIKPGEHRPWLWFYLADRDGKEGKAPDDLLCRPLQAGLDWSWARFSVSEAGNYHVRIRDRSMPQKFTILPIGVTTQV